MRPRQATLLLVGDGLSAFGGWIDFLAILTLAAYQFQVSPYQMALVPAAGLLAGPAIGRWCDRGPTQRLLMGSIVGRMMATGAILVCADLPLFVVLVGLRSLFASVAPPAINVLAQHTVEADHRPRFFSLLNVLNNSAKVLAPAIGTVSSSLVGERWALALSLLFSTAALAAFGLLRRPVDAADPAPAAASAKAGAPGATPLLPLLWLTATCAFFVFMVNNLVPLVLQREGFDKALLGLLVSCSGAGNIVSGSWLARQAGRPSSSGTNGTLIGMLRPAVWQALGFAAIGGLFAARPPLVEPLLCLLFFAIGCASARFAIAMSVVVSVQHAAQVGRVWGLIQSWQSAMILLAPLIGAAVLDHFGPAALFAVATGSAGLSFGLWRWGFVGRARLRPTGTGRPSARHP